MPSATSDPAKSLFEAHGPDNGYSAVVVHVRRRRGDTRRPQVLQEMAQRWPDQFESHTVGFGHGGEALEQMAFARGELD